MVSLCLQTQQKSIYETGGYQTSYLHKTPPKTKHSSLNQNFFFYKRALISTLPFKNDSCFNKDQYNFKKSNREIMRKIKVKYWLITTGLHWSWNRLYTSPEKKANKNCKSVFVSILYVLVTKITTFCPSHQWLTEFIIITCHSLTS